MPNSKPEIPDSSRLAAVTVGLVDGKSIDAQIARFAPQAVDIELILDAGRAQLVPGEQIAFIGFHREQRSAAPRPGEIKQKQLRLHVCGNNVFDVEVEPTALSNPLGFFAQPTTSDSPYTRVFFYAHGINAREIPTRLGDLLLQQGVLDAQGLQQSLDQQERNRGTPIGEILVQQAQVDRGAVEQAIALQKRKPLRIGELLVSAGWITDEQLGQALAEQKRRKGKRIGEMLVELGLVTEHVLSSTLASKFLLPLVDLDDYPIEPPAAYAIPKDVIAKFVVLPVRESPQSITLAISDPLAVDAIETARLHARRKVEELMVVPSQLRRYVTETLARLDAEAVEAGMEELLEEIEEQDRLEEQASARDRGNDVDESDSTVIRLVNRVIVEAYRRGASDIHVEPQGKEAKLRIRLRIDGVCEVYQELPPALRRPVVARIKIMARLDISERRLPQDGKIRFHTRSGAIELRVATLPTSSGDEDVVLRILASSKPLPPESMRYSARNLAQLTSLTHRPYGLFLCVGPTGSGKTTTLHSVLGTLNQPDKKIWTAEDPVEITQPGLRQVQMQAKIGLTFATALRAFLRADPDIVMVGEMRDYETAHIGIEASLTGHLVLSTLHTNSAPETITRLIDMGLDPFSFADALLGVLAQRLARTLCSKCKEPDSPTDEELFELRGLYGAEFDEDFAEPAKLQVWTARGCDDCRLGGYRGRIGLHELLTVNDPMRAAIGHKAPIGELRELAKAAGMRTLLQDGIQKVFAGYTDLRQVLAVCSR